MFFFIQTRIFVFTTWPAFFMNVYSCHTCFRLEATTKEIQPRWMEVFHSSIRPSLFPHQLPSLHTLPSPPHLVASLLCQTYKTVYSCLADISFHNPAHTHRHTCSYSLSSRVEDSHSACACLGLILQVSNSGFLVFSRWLCCMWLHRSILHVVLIVVRAVVQLKICCSGQMWLKD